jgi:hypothetical protein
MTSRDLTVKMNEEWWIPETHCYSCLLGNIWCVGLYIYCGIAQVGLNTCYSAIKKNEIMLFVRKWVEHHSKQHKPGSERQISQVLSYVQNLDLKKYMRDCLGVRKSMCGRTKGVRVCGVSIKILYTYMKIKQ